MNFPEAGIGNLQVKLEAGLPSLPATYTIQITLSSVLDLIKPDSSHAEYVWNPSMIIRLELVSKLVYFKLAPHKNLCTLGYQKRDTDGQDRAICHG